MVLNLYSIACWAMDYTDGKMETYTDFRREAEKIADAHGIDHSLLPKDSYAEDGHWVSVQGMRCLYFYGERGEETVTYCDNFESLLYQTFKDLTGNEAFDFAVKNRIKGKDYNRIRIPRHVESMMTISVEWGNRLQTEYNELLQENPFDDILTQRLELMSELFDQGMSLEEISALAEKEFPYPETDE